MMILSCGYCGYLTIIYPGQERLQGARTISGGSALLSLAVAEPSRSAVFGCPFLVELLCSAGRWWSFHAPLRPSWRGVCLTPAPWWPTARTTTPRGSAPTFSLCQKVLSITFQLGNNSAKERVAFDTTIQTHTHTHTREGKASGPLPTGYHSGFCECRDLEVAAGA